MRRIRRWLTRFHPRSSRIRATLRRAPRRAVRNVLLLWMAILLAAAVPVAYRWATSERDVAVVALQHWHDTLEAARSALPTWDEHAVEERTLASTALKMALPASVADGVFADVRAMPSWRTVVRYAVRALTGVDVIDPVSVLAFELPGFDALVEAGDALPASARTLVLPTPSGPRSSTLPRLPSPGPQPPADPTDPTAPTAPLLPGSPTPGPDSGQQPTPPLPPEEQPPTIPTPPADPPPMSPLDRLRSVAWGDECRVLIYHTHTSEMYRTAEFAPVDPDMYHVFNTTDTGIVHVGRAMADYLEQVGIPTCHLTAIHDWPSHPRAYIEARATVERFLQQNPHVDIVLDVHRDAPPDLVTTVAGRRAAQIAFVLGTNTGMHPSWPQNAAFARSLADLLNERYPGLFRRIIDRPDARLNQDLHPRAILVEIGSYDTHLSEALTSAEMFAEVVADMLYMMRFGRSVFDEIP